jgi:hypothetical protein
MRAPTAHGAAHLVHAASCQHDLCKTSGRREAWVASYGMPSQAAASSMVRPKRRGESNVAHAADASTHLLLPRLARGASASRRRPTASHLAHHHHQARHRAVLTAALGPNHLQPLMLARCDARLPAAGHRLASREHLLNAAARPRSRCSSHVQSEVCDAACSAGAMLRPCRSRFSCLLLPLSCCSSALPQPEQCRRLRRCASVLAICSAGGVACSSVQRCGAASALGAAASRHLTDETCGRTERQHDGRGGRP